MSSDVNPFPSRNQRGGAEAQPDLQPRIQAPCHVQLRPHLVHVAVHLPVALHGVALNLRQLVPELPRHSQLAVKFVGCLLALEVGDPGLLLCVLQLRLLKTQVTKCNQQGRAALGRLP